MNFPYADGSFEDEFYDYSNVTPFERLTAVIASVLTAWDRAGLDGIIQRAMQGQGQGQGTGRNLPLGLSRSRYPGAHNHGCTLVMAQVRDLQRSWCEAFRDTQGPGPLQANPTRAPTWWS